MYWYPSFYNNLDNSTIWDASGSVYLYICKYDNNMRHFLKIFHLCMALLLCVHVAAQQRWSLLQCINYAQENNLQIKQLELSQEQAENNLKAAKLEYFPSLNASIGYNMSWGRSVNLNDLEIVENKLSQSSSVNLSSSLPLFEGMRKQNNIKSSAKQLEITRANIENLKDNISISIAKGYLQVLLYREIEKCALKSYNNTEAQVVRTQELVDAGTQTYSSLLEVKSQLANDKLQLVTASNNHKSALLELSQLLNLPAHEQLEIEDPAIENISLAMEEEDIGLIYANMGFLPRIRKAELELEYSRLQYKIQKGSALPTLSLNAGYGTYYSDNQSTSLLTQFDNNRNPSLGFGLSIPIFNSRRTNTAIRNARSNVRSSEIGVEIATQELMKEIQLAWNEVVACHGKMEAAASNLEASRETFTHTAEKFNLGLLNGTDYSTAKTNLFKAESEYIQTKYQYIFQKKIMEYYKCGHVETE